MIKQLQPWLDKFDALAERERLSVLLLVAVAAFIIFLELFITPISNQYDRNNKQIKTLNNQAMQTQAQIAVVRSQQALDPNLQENQKLKLINEQLEKVNAQLKEKMHGLIEPKQMARVLEVVLQQNTDLKLQRVQSLGAVPLTGLNVKEKETGKKESLGVYRHGLQIEFKGSYLSTLKYLRALHELPWNFYWDVLELNVEKYPLSNIVITVHTLSFHEGWIGV